MVMGVLVGTATVTTQGLTGLLRHDETKSGDFYLAISGDSQLATSGDFFMATDTRVTILQMCGPDTSPTPDDAASPASHLEGWTRQEQPPVGGQHMTGDP